MIHFVLHDARDTVAVVVVEDVKAGMSLSGWIMDEDKMTSVQARQDINPRSIEEARKLYPPKK